MMRFISIISIFIFLFSCHNEQKKEDFENEKYIETFGASKDVRIGNSRLFIGLPSTHYIDEVKGNGFVEFRIRSIDTTINKGQGVIRFNLKSNEKDESMVKDTTIANVEYETANDSGNGPQIYIWSENGANTVEQFNLSQVMSSTHR